jgi:hypothetical protein
MHRSLRQKVVATAAVAVLVGGLALAAVSATGQGDAHRGARHGAHRNSARDLATAASYLGISSAQLAGELRQGKTLAQVAAATSGKSAQGLSTALLAARQAKLAKAGAHLQQRVAAEVNRPGGPGGGEGAANASKRGARLQAMFSSPKHIGSVAASYLGVAPEQLQSQLSAGKTLAQVADATAGKSRAGLIAALVASRRTRLDAALASGRVSHAKGAKRGAALQARASALVQRSFAQAAHPG